MRGLLYIGYFFLILFNSVAMTYYHFRFFQPDIYYNILYIYCLDIMKRIGLNIRTSQNILNKLRLYAVENEKKNYPSN